MSQGPFLGARLVPPPLLFPLGADFGKLTCQNKLALIPVLGDQDLVKMSTWKDVAITAGGYVLFLFFPVYKWCMSCLILGDDINRPLWRLSPSLGAKTLVPYRYLPCQDFFLFPSLILVRGHGSCLRAWMVAVVYTRWIGLSRSESDHSSPSLWHLTLSLTLSRFRPLPA